MSKAKEIIERIVVAKDFGEAKAIVIDLMTELNMREDYSALMYQHNALKGFQSDFKELQDSYIALGDIKNYSAVNTVRTNCSFLYREISDALSSKVNFAKKFHEEGKTVSRAKARQDLISKEEKDAKKRSETLIREYIGESDVYDEWVKLNAMAYANYQELISLLESIRLFSDALASESRGLYMIESKDVK